MHEMALSVPPWPVLLSTIIIIRNAESIGELSQARFADHQNPITLSLGCRPRGRGQTASAHDPFRTIQNRPACPLDEGYTVPAEKFLYFDGILIARRAVSVSLAPVPKDQPSRHFKRVQLWPLDAIISLIGVFAANNFESHASADFCDGYRTWDHNLVDVFQRTYVTHCLGENQPVEFAPRRQTVRNLHLSAAL